MTTSPRIPGELQDLKPSYRSDVATLRGAFFEPCFRHCLGYDRAAGYFSASVLRSWLAFLDRLLEGRPPTIRLLISPELDPHDAEALRQATDPAERRRLLELCVEMFVRRILSAPDGAETEAYLTELFAWLVAQGHLEIRFAFTGDKGEPGIFHEKSGVFSFPGDLYVAFTGSANETLAGHEKNFESLDVFRSWVSEDAERVAIKRAQFEEAWSGRVPGLSVVRPSPEVLALIQGHAPSARPSPPPTSLCSFPVKLRPYQEAALRAWIENSSRGLLEMCTGSGKTIVALAAVEYAFARGIADVAIVACPTKVLVDQWHAKILGTLPRVPTIVAYEAAASYASLLGALLNQACAHTTATIIVTTYHSLLETGLLGRLRQACAAGARSLFVADEGHHLALGSAQNRLEALSDMFPYRLGLSATPEIEGSPERTALLVEFFGGRVFTYTLEDAIQDGVLCPYYYHPMPTFLTSDLSAEFVEWLRAFYNARGPEVRNLRERLNQILLRSQHFLDGLADSLRSIERLRGDLRWTVVFSPPGKADQDTRLVSVIKKYLEDRYILVGSILATTRPADRREVLRAFEAGEFHVLLGIGCLDEGFDAPRARNAVLLYSFDRRRQFIQRRGRVLRPTGGKSEARLFDLIVLPDPYAARQSEAEDLLARELRRYSEFAASALNQAEAEDMLAQILQRYKKGERDV